MTTPSAERVDLSGRSFVTFQHPDGASTELLLIRHGQTEANISGLLVGRKDVLLTDLGHRQAEATAAAVVRRNPDAIVTSPLQRAQQSAAPIIAATGLYPEVLDDIAEFSFGDLEGWSEPDVLNAHPHLQPLVQGIASPDEAWPGGESANTFVERIIRGLRYILTTYCNRRVAVVTHGGVIGTFGAVLVHSGDVSFFPYLVHNCSISTVTIDAHGSTCASWNEGSHLMQELRAQ